MAQPLYCGPVDGSVMRVNFLTESGWHHGIVFSSRTAIAVRVFCIVHFIFIKGDKENVKEK